MLTVKLIAAGLLIVGTVFALFRIHRWIRTESGLHTAPARTKSGNEKSSGNAAELEALIAAYQRDKAARDTPGAAQPPAAAAAAVPAPLAAAPAAAQPPLTTYALRKPIVPAHVKLCYLVIKTALPQHHVFCNARLGDALELHDNHPLANLRIDLIVCNKDLTPVATIDVANTDERNGAPDREKVQLLQRAGVRYIRFAPGAIPKRAEVRDELLRM